MKYTTLSNLPFEHVTHKEDIFKQVFLRKSDVPHILSFSQSTLKVGQRVEEHAHRDMFEVFFIQSGNGKLMINLKEYDLKPGICVVIEPMEKHTLWCTSKESLVLLYFGVES